MHILLTTCCKEKDPAPGNLPAMKRYVSKRISDVYDESIKQNIPMRIFSGVYGLLKPDDLIPFYDHPLSLSEVSLLLPLALEQMQKDFVSQITFYTQPRQTPGWEPYFQVIEQACQALAIKLDIKII